MHCPHASRVSPRIHSTYILQPVDIVYNSTPDVIAKLNRITTEITTDLDLHCFQFSL
jgi:hypothetical protein